MRTREAAIYVNGNPSLDIDPITIEDRGDGYSSPFDVNLMGLLHSLDVLIEELGDGGRNADLAVRWTDTGDCVWLECPACDGKDLASSFTVLDDDDEDGPVLICDECA